jgi:raffinose/stachyose/melibiose transport system permease protein
VTVPVATAAPTRRRGRPGEPRAVGYLYVAPAMAVAGAFMLWPTWVGLQNYVDVLTDPELRAPFLHAGVLVVFFSLIPVLVGLVLAGLMSRTALRGAGFFRTVLFLPQVIAMTVVAIAWNDIYAPQGVLNDVLRAVGLDGLTRAWLGESGTALAAVGVVGTWVGTGLCVVLFLAGLSKVPRELYEAARLDGAGPVSEFLAVSLPAVRGEIAVALTLTIVAALRTFDLVYILTPGGGPGNSTTVPSYEVYYRSFERGQVGTGVTIALLLTAVILLLTVLVNRFAERTD